MTREQRIRYRKPANGFATAIALGLSIGLGIVFARYYGPEIMRRHGTEFLENRFGIESRAPEQPQTNQRVLLKAESPVLIYRASAIDIRPKTNIDAAVMAAQPSIMEAYKDEAQSALDELDTTKRSPWTVQTYFTKTAEAGTLSSILRSDYIHKGDRIHRLSYSASLVDTNQPDGIVLQSLFDVTDQDISQLDLIVCKALQSQKNQRLGHIPQTPEDETPIADTSESAPCLPDENLSFFNGAPVVLAPSSRKNTLGGLMFYFEPGRVGDLKEGEYVISIPQNDFRKYLRPEYQPLFAGDLRASG